MVTRTRGRLAGPVRLASVPPAAVAAAVAVAAAAVAAAVAVAAAAVAVAAAVAAAAVAVAVAVAVAMPAAAVAVAITAAIAVAAAIALEGTKRHRAGKASNTQPNVAHPVTSVHQSPQCLLTFNLHQTNR
jgi:hypothetical protein